MTANFLPYPRFKGFDETAGFLVGGKLWTYIAGTNTQKATYTDRSGSTANANPVILDGSGEADVYLAVGSYKLILTDANDVPVWTEDNVTAQPADLSGIVFADQYSTIQAAINALPASGGIIYVRPGTYAGPTTLHNNVQLIAYCASPTSAALHSNINFVEIPDSKVVFTYTADLTLDSLQSVRLEGIILDFQNYDAGMIMKGCTNCLFPNLVIQNVTGGAGKYGLAMYGNGTGGQTLCALNHFGDLWLMNCNNGIYMEGPGATAVTLNRFDSVYLWMANGFSGIGINFYSRADTNKFGTVFMSSIGSTGVGVVFNGTATPLVETDAGNNTFDQLTITPNMPYAGTALIHINKSNGNVIKNYSFFGGTELATVQGVGTWYVLEVAMDLNGTIAGDASGDRYGHRLVVTGLTPTTLSGAQIGLGAITATAANAGANGAAPATVDGYLEIAVGSVIRKIPYYLP